jgi:hypothetical protein
MKFGNTQHHWTFEARSLTADGFDRVERERRERTELAFFFFLSVE